MTFVDKISITWKSVPISYTLKIFHNDNIEYIYNALNNIPEDKLSEDTVSEIPLVPRLVNGV